VYRRRTSANHVLASIIANNPDMYFSEFESQPFLASHFKVSNTSGKVLFETEVMSPRSD
jgi:hypothetical protein